MFADIQSVFISDAHLGSRHAQAEKLLHFLSELNKNCVPKKLYLVGDFIDGWKIKRKLWYWDDKCNLVIRKILTLVKKGTEVIYVAGNHDEFLREFLNESDSLKFGNIKFCNEIVHTTVDGKKLLVVHGDIFDFVTKYAKWISVIGDVGYEVLLKINTFFNWIQKFFWKKQWSMSAAVKSGVKQAINYAGDFEKILIAYSQSKECEGCICGHIHTADLKNINNFLYVNCGDWVESCTAILENSKGELILFNNN